MTRVRRAAVEDAAELALAHVAAWQAGYAGLMPADYLDSLTAELPGRVVRWQRRIAESVDGQDLLVAETKSHLIGFVMYGPPRDSGVPKTLGELWAINVAPEAWGTDVAPALLAAAECHLADRYGGAYLWVLEGNVRARRFYEKYGWAADGGRKVDRSHGFDLALVRYVKALAGETASPSGR